MDERRKSKRMDLMATISLKGLTGDKEEVNIDILDVSQTGIGFICDKPLEIGAMYDTDLKIWTGDIIHVIIEIVRKNGDEESAIYGGHFVGMPEADWCRIRVYETYQEYSE